MRPYTGYVEEKQRRLSGAIDGLLNGPDNDYNMRYALQSVEAYAQLIVDEAQLKCQAVLERIIETDPDEHNEEYRKELEELNQRRKGNND